MWIGASLKEEELNSVVRQRLMDKGNRHGAEIEDDIMPLFLINGFSGGRQDPVSGFYHAAGLL